MVPSLSIHNKGRRHPGLRGCFVFLLFSVIIGAASWMTPIEYDGAYNFQVAQSLQKKFTYQTRYVPSKVYDDRVTTNGPIQYFMAVMIGIFDLDLGRSIALGTIAGLAAVIFFLYSQQSFYLYCLLLLLWPSFAWTHINFWGELFAIAMTMAALIAWEGWFSEVMIHAPSQGRVLFKLCRSPYFLLSGLFLGMAISTKLMAAPASLLLLFCLVIYKLREKPKSGLRAHDVHLWLLLFILPCSIALVIFGIQFSVSILHSGGHLGTIWPTLKLFIESHFQQAEVAASRLDASRWQPKAESLPSLIVLLALLIYLLRRHVIFLLPGIAIAALLFAGQFKLRRIMTLMLPVMLLAAKEIQASNPVINKSARPAFPDWPLVGVGVILIVGAFFSNQPVPLLKIISQFHCKGAQPNQLFYPGKATKDNLYDPNLIPKIEALPGRIFTSGWYQFPEISLRTQTVFYDRFASENFSLLLPNSSPCFLLFDSEGPRDNTTEQDLCGEILHRRGSLILCQYRPH